MKSLLLSILISCTANTLKGNVVLVPYYFSLSRVIAVLTLFLLFSCQSQNRISAANHQDNPSLEIRGLVLKNLGHLSIDKVTLRVAATHKFITCGHIPSGEECSTTFPLKEYQGNSISVSWHRDGNEFVKNNFYVDSSGIADIKVPAFVVVTIDSKNNVLAEFIQ